MVNKFEAIGIALSIGAMALALFLIRIETTGNAFQASVHSADSAIYVDGEVDQQAGIAKAVTESVNSVGEIQKLIIDDVLIGTGDLVEEGDTVTVNYIGTLQNGQQFDNSYTRGEPFTFTVGEGRVITGWEQGLVGMKTGGQRVLVIPSHLAYGKNGFGPIPGGATLVFAIELLSIE